jgi:hypothetical protein
MSIAVLGAVISVIAAAGAVVSAVWARRSGQVQTSSAQDDLQDKFNQLITTLTKLQAEAGELGVQGMAPAGSAALAKQFGIGNQLEVIGGQAHAMLHPPDPSEPTPDLEWSAAYILATTFDQTWHADWAEQYWEKSVEKAEDDAKVIALVGAARHYFMRNDEGDLGRGRTCHSDAIEVIDRIGRGNDMCFQQKCSVYFEGVTAEYGAGNWNEMITALWKCFKAAEQIHTPMKAMWCKSPLFGFIDQWNLLPGMNAAPDATVDEKSALMTELNQWRTQRALQAQAAAFAQAAAVAPWAQPAPQDQGQQAPQAPPSAQPAQWPQVLPGLHEPDPQTAAGAEADTVHPFWGTPDAPPQWGVPADGSLNLDGLFHTPPEGTTAAAGSDPAGAVGAGPDTSPGTGSADPAVS